MTSFIALALAGLSLAPAPATAAAEPKAATGAPRAEQATARPSPDRRYCYKYEVTGSIMHYKTCKTYAEWMKDGVDPTAKP